jgi:hypothetical protein
VTVAGAERGPGRRGAGSRTWIKRLKATGAERDAALVELHVPLSRAARFEVNRRRTISPLLRRDDNDDLAHRSADHMCVLFWVSPTYDLKCHARHTVATPCGSAPRRRLATPKPGPDDETNTQPVC